MERGHLTNKGPSVYCVVSFPSSIVVKPNQEHTIDFLSFLTKNIFSQHKILQQSIVDNYQASNHSL